MCCENILESIPLRNVKFIEILQYVVFIWNSFCFSLSENQAEYPKAAEITREERWHKNRSWSAVCFHKNHSN
jgi:hypothetical protein